MLILSRDHCQSLWVKILSGLVWSRVWPAQIEPPLGGCISLIHSSWRLVPDASSLRPARLMLERRKLSASADRQPAPVFQLRRIDSSGELNASEKFRALVCFLTQRQVQLSLLS
jgi:hypothetical protein